MKKYAWMAVIGILIIATIVAYFVVRAQQASVNFSLQERCADMAKSFFSKFNDPNQGLDISGWASPIQGFSYGYINHYNSTYNSCFILIKGDNLMEQTFGLYDIVQNKFDASKISNLKGVSCFVFDIRATNGSAANSCGVYDQFVHEHMEGSEIN